jgi:hypothetical protein
VPADRAALARERLDHRWAGAWVQLLDIAPDDDVLLLDVAPSRALERLADRARVVAVRPGRGSGPRVVAAEPDEHLRRSWDLIVVDGAVPETDQLRRLADALRDGGRLAVATDNPWSPLTRSSTFAGPEAFGPGLPGKHCRPRQLERGLRGAGLDVDQWFGLLRSSTVSTTAFELHSPAASRTVLAAALVHLTGRRAAGARLLRRLPPAAQRMLVPGWLVVARREGDDPRAHGLPIVGRMGYERTPDAKLLLGEPPAALERTYATTHGAEAEAMALEALAVAGLEVAPRLLGRPALDTCRIEWVDGQDLPVRSMPSAELVRRTEEAARLLGRIQAATRRRNGTVLVHGDYWLGNVLLSGDRLRWVIDWGAARWGDPEVDALFLVHGLEGFRPLPPALVVQLTAAVRAGLSAA